MKTLATHYARLLGTDDSWRVLAVDLRLEDRRVELDDHENDPGETVNVPLVRLERVL